MLFSLFVVAVDGAATDLPLLLCKSKSRVLRSRLSGRGRLQVICVGKIVWALMTNFSSGVKLKHLDFFFFLQITNSQNISKQSVRSLIQTDLFAK